MRREAEANADTDKAKRELVDLKNQVDHLIHQTEKSLVEHKDKLEAADVQAIESARDDLKKAAESEDKAAIEKALAEFQTKAQKLGEVLYKEAQAGASAEGGPGTAPEGEAAGSGDSGDDEPVDADFEVKA